MHYDIVLLGLTPDHCLHCPAYPPLPSFSDLVEPVVLNANGQPPADLLSQIDALAAQLTSEVLYGYSGSQLFEMQEKLAGMTKCIMKNLQSRWKSPPHDSSD